MNVFVLCTGRSGSMTFSRACRYITNYSVGHESRARLLGPDRFDYPDRHMEADNRLAWFPGALDREFGNDAYYVHLFRDPEETIASYNRRWVRNGSLIRAYCEGIHQITIHLLDKRRRKEVVEDFYDNVNANIRTFLKDKTRVLYLPLEEAETVFPRFWKEIGAEGDLESALKVFTYRHNASKTGWFKLWKHEMRFRAMRFRWRLF